MTYLQRYLNGDHEGVWTDLRHLGENVWSDASYEDARDVARETMRRVRKNIEVIIPRFYAIGFVFGYDHLIRMDLASISNVNDWLRYYHLYRWTQQQYPVFLTPHLKREADDEFRTLSPEDYAFANWGLPDVIPDPLKPETDPDPPNMRSYLSMIEQHMGRLPLSVHAWYDQVGAVNFYGYHEQWHTLLRTLHPEVYRNSVHHNYLMSFCEPLQVLPLNRQVLEYLQRQEREKYPRPDFDFAESENFRDYYGGTTSSYSFSFRDATADEMLYLYETQPQGTPFVDYLRHCFRWGGFPGMARWAQVPQDDLDFLTRDLLPF